LLFLSILISGCGGGGGGSSTTIVNYKTAEYTAQYGLGKINAAEIYSDGYSGSDVTVAVIDVGVDLDHPDLIDNIALGSYDYLDSDSDANPDGQGAFMSHGTHVAGVIASMKNDVGMHGVAYNSKILSLRAGDSSGTLYDSALINAYSGAISKGAKVINNSWGVDTFSAAGGSKLLEARTNDIISVFAAGNDGLSNPGYYALTPNVSGYEALADSLIAVVATDSNNTIATFSNECGVAKNWCMAAPGADVYSTVDIDDNNSSTNYGTMSGTSQSAPHVSGAAAILRSKWPSKTAAEIVTILYDTATDLGDVGTDTIYGRGLLNLDNAIYAQGVLSVFTLPGVSYLLSDSSLSVSSMLGDSLNQSLSSAVFDKYKRDYYYDLNTRVHEPAVVSMLDELLYGDSSIFVDIEPGVRLLSEVGKGSVQIQYDYEGLKFSFSHKQAPNQIFGLNNQTNLVGLSDQYSIYSDSHLSQIDNASIINIVNSGDITTSLGVISGYIEPDNKHSIDGVNLSFSIKPIQNLSLLAQLSHLEEKDTFLSSYFSGAYKTGASNTNAINLTSQAKFTDGLSLFAQYNKGQTKVSSLTDSVVSNVSTIDSEGYSLSLIKNGLYSENDTLFATFKQPLRVISGDVILKTANGLNMDDSISFTEQAIGLSPTGTEQALTLGYLTDHNKDTAMIFLLNYRDNPNHNSSTKSENQVMIKMTKKF